MNPTTFYRVGGASEPTCGATCRSQRVSLNTSPPGPVPSTEPWTTAGTVVQTPARTLNADSVTNDSHSFRYFGNYGKFVRGPGYNTAVFDTQAKGTGMAIYQAGVIVSDALTPRSSLMHTELTVNKCLLNNKIV